MTTPRLATAAALLFLGGSAAVLLRPGSPTPLPSDGRGIKGEGSFTPAAPAPAPAPAYTISFAPVCCHRDAATGTPVLQTATLRWLAESGALYRIERRDSLHSPGGEGQGEGGPWTLITPVDAGTGGPTVVALDLCVADTSNNWRVVWE